MIGCEHPAFPVAYSERIRQHSAKVDADEGHHRQNMIIVEAGPEHT